MKMNIQQQKLCLKKFPFLIKNKQKKQIIEKRLGIYSTNIRKYLEKRNQLN